MSDTPRTDSAQFVVGDEEHGPYVEPEFAKTLERENAALVASLRKAINAVMYRADPANHEPPPAEWLLEAKALLAKYA